MINEEIKAARVKVVSEDGKGLTEMTLEDAIKIAEETDDDVICLNSKEEIPIVKIGDYGKMLYEKQKKEKENKRKQRLNTKDIKEIRIGDMTAENDLKTKAKNIDRILNDGDKVMLSIRYKGRSVRMIHEGPSKLQNLTGLITAKFIIEKTPKIEGNRVTMVVAPSK